MMILTDRKQSRKTTVTTKSRTFFISVKVAEQSDAPVGLNHHQMSGANEDGSETLCMIVIGQQHMKNPES